jgi:nucleotide-binding universal stress UspA family protein
MSTSGEHAPRVVVGYDGSVSAKVAAGWAADEAERLGAGLAVVYAADYTGLVGGPVSTSPWLPGVSIDEARRVAEAGAALARARRPGLAVEARTEIGSPAPSCSGSPRARRSSSSAPAATATSPAPCSAPSPRG